MRTFRYSFRSGASFIDLILSMGIIGILFGGIFLVYFSLLDSANKIESRNAATALMSQKIEIIRNMPYESVGTLGGIPAGVITQTETSTFGNQLFSLETNVRNIDDQFDGTLGGSPGDTSPADYKMVTITATCLTCPNFLPLSLSAVVAPKSLESGSNQGSLFINVLDALGGGVQAATVRVVNASVTPSIDFTDTTNASGVLQLVGVPTSTQAYQIFVSKEGYSSEQTYPVGGGGNPNPLKPNLTVTTQGITNSSYLIDKVSTLTVLSSDVYCSAIANADFSVAGTKLIGTSPDVLKFETSSATNASGIKTFSALEWDTYKFQFNESGYNLLGTVPLDPLVLNPNVSSSLRFVARPAANPSLQVGVRDLGTNAGIQNATVTLSRAGFSETQTTGQFVFTETDWSGGNYSSEDGGIDEDSSPGSLVLERNASSTYTTSTTHWLISNTKDFGTSSTAFYSISWNPETQPPSTGAQSLRFQIAANNDNATWNFVGPDGTGGTYFTASGSALPGSISGRRYVRWRAYLSTEDENSTPALDDISLHFSSSCVPSSQVLFRSLPVAGTYTITASASGYTTATSSVSVGSSFTSSTIFLSP